MARVEKDDFTVPPNPNRSAILRNTILRIHPADAHKLRASSAEPPKPRTHLQRRQVGVELREAVQHHGAALSGHLQPDAAPEAPGPPAALEHPLGAGGAMVRRGPAAAHHRRGRRIPGCPEPRRRPRQPPRLPGEPQRGCGGDAGGRGEERSGAGTAQERADVTAGQARSRLGCKAPLGFLPPAASARPQGPARLGSAPSGRGNGDGDTAGVKSTEDAQRGRCEGGGG